MVRKLDDFYYDQTKWKLDYDEHDNLYLVQLSNSERQYNIGSRLKIKALTQVSENTFIVLEEYNQFDVPTYYLRLYSISDKEDIEEVSSVSYNYSCKFWADTIVFLDSRTVYDLSKDEIVDKYLSVLRYLDDNNFYTTSNHRLMQKGNREYLFCTAEIISSKLLLCRDFLQFLIDVETCKIVLPVYSTLRDSFIDLTDTFTLKDLIHEEHQYKRIIDTHMINSSLAALAAGEKVLLAAFDED